MKSIDVGCIMTNSTRALATAADRLAELYDESFGGKPNGRYRISMKLVRELAGRRRLYEIDIRNLGKELLERGYVMIDMDSFLVVMSANTFINYRRVREDKIT